MAGRVRRKTVSEKNTWIFYFTKRELRQLVQQRGTEIYKEPHNIEIRLSNLSFLKFSPFHADVCFSVFRYIKAFWTWIHEDTSEINNIKMCKIRLLRISQKTTHTTRPQQSEQRPFFDQSGARETRAKLTCFPAFGTGCIFSRAQNDYLFSPRSAMITCFPAFGTGRMFFPALSDDCSQL